MATKEKWCCLQAFRRVGVPAVKLLLIPGLTEAFFDGGLGVAFFDMPVRAPPLMFRSPCFKHCLRRGIVALALRLLALCAGGHCSGVLPRDATQALL